MKDEFRLIEGFKKILESKKTKNYVGIGDDCALVELGKKTVISVDSMVEDIHFKREYNPKKVGFKLTSVNVSDLVSCGGRPKFAVISVELPKDLDQKWILDFYKGVKKGCKEYGFKIVGGNTVKAEKLSFSMTLFGETKRFVPRSGAKEGDLLFLSSYTGLSKRGLEIISNDLKKSKKLINSHLKPKARVDLSSFLAKNATAAIDISDGLLQDLKHLEEKSKKSFYVDSKKLPIHKELLKSLKNRDKAIAYVLNGGEDYQILFTIRPKYRLAALKLGMYEIGYTQTGKGIYVDNKVIFPEGFKHF